MVKTIWLSVDAKYDDIGDRLNAFLADFKITRERLIDIKYGIINCDGDFCTSALVIYEA